MDEEKVLRLTIGELREHAGGERWGC